LEAILPLMRLHGRVAVCGMIGQYNDADNPHGVKTLWQLVVNRIKMQGFITYDYPDVLDQAQQELDGWVADGKLTPLANVREGFERLPEAFIDLMSGKTIGKTIVLI
jgi:NADPH-dependent curcumin reductase CurA